MSLFAVALLPWFMAATSPSADSVGTFNNAYQWSGHPAKDNATSWAQAIEDNVDALQAQTAGTTASYVKSQVSVKTADGNITAAETGSVYVSSKTGTLTLTLPQAATGLTFTVIDDSATAADDVIVDIQAGDNIEGDTNGDGLICTDDTVGSSVTLIATSATRWTVLSTTGTWAAQ